MKIILLLLSLLLLFSCSNESTSEFSPDKLSTIKLNSVFDSDSEGINFGFIRNIQLDSFGNIYVSDEGSNSIFIFSSDGNLIKEFVNRGQGPGEYSTLAQISIKDNRLYIIDSSNLKVIEYEVENENAKLTHIEDTLYPDRAFRKVVNFWPWDDNTYLFVFGEGFSRHNLWEPKFERLQFFDKTTEEYTQLFQLPQLERFLYSNGNSFGIRTLPYGSKPTFELTNGNLFYGHNSETEIYNLNFEDTTSSETVIKFNIDSDTVSEEERQSVLNDDFYRNRNLTNEIREQLPEFLPYYDTFVIDDEENFWLAMNYDGNRNGNLWWVFNSAGEGLYQIELDDPVIFKNIANGSAYGVKESEMGEQSFVKYSF